MLKFADLREASVVLSQAKVHNLDLVVHALSLVACHRELEFTIFAVSESNRIVREVTLVRVDLSCLWRLRQNVDLVLVHGRPTVECLRRSDRLLMPVNHLHATVWLLLCFRLLLR